MMTNQKLFYGILIVLIAIIGISLLAYLKPTITSPEITPPEDQLPNPASVYCEEQGYTLEIRTSASGGERGFCIFDDGSECEEWDFFQGKCKKGEHVCKDLCGDGICQEIVCLAVGCPCSESPKTCPIDCKT